MDLWRRGWDSNPRTPVKMLLEFQSSAFDRSATSPFNVLQIYLKVDYQCCDRQSTRERVNSSNRLGKAPIGCARCHQPGRRPGRRHGRRRRRRRCSGRRCRAAERRARPEPPVIRRWRGDRRRHGCRRRGCRDRAAPVRVWLRGSSEAAGRRIRRLRQARLGLAAHAVRLLSCGDLDGIARIRRAHAFGHLAAAVEISVLPRERLFGAADEFSLRRDETCGSQTEQPDSSGNVDAANQQRAEHGARGDAALRSRRLRLRQRCGWPRAASSAARTRARNGSDSSVNGRRMPRSIRPCSLMAHFTGIGLASTNSASCSARNGASSRSTAARSPRSAAALNCAIASGHNICRHRNHSSRAVEHRLARPRIIAREHRELRAGQSRPVRAPAPSRPPPL